MIKRQNVKRFIKAKLHTIHLKFSILTNQVIGRTVMVELRFFFVLQLWDDSLSQELAELDTPLVEDRCSKLLPV